MKGLLVVLVVGLAVLYAKYRASKIADDAVSAAEQGARAPLNLFSPAYWGLKDDGGTFGTRGWWSNLWSTAPDTAGAEAPDQIEWIGDIPNPTS